MGDPTKLSHYMNYPICGACMSAWDIIYDRLRVGNKYRNYMSPAECLDGCKVGGCDPDIWDFIDEETGWPLGVELGDNSGQPVAYAFRRETGRGRFVIVAPYDNRLYHRSDSDARDWVSPGSAPYHRTSERLQKENIARTEKHKAAMAGINLEDESLWDDDDEEDDEPVNDVAIAMEEDYENDLASEIADIDDPDIW